MPTVISDSCCQKVQYYVHMGVFDKIGDNWQKISVHFIYPYTENCSTNADLTRIFAQFSYSYQKLQITDQESILIGTIVRAGVRMRILIHMCFNYSPHLQQILICSS